MAGALTDSRIPSHRISRRFRIQSQLRESCCGIPQFPPATPRALEYSAGKTMLSIGPQVSENQARHGRASISAIVRRIAGSRGRNFYAINRGLPADLPGGLKIESVATSTRHIPSRHRPPPGRASAPLVGASGERQRRPSLRRVSRCRAAPAQTRDRRGAARCASASAWPRSGRWRRRERGR
jgi:hypothetical protein